MCAFGAGGGLWIFGESRYSRANKHGLKSCRKAAEAIPFRAIFPALREK